MTEPMRDFDELASAYLDDEATDEERARVDADPELRARVQAMAGARDALRGGITPLADGARDALVAAALAQLDRDAGAATPSPVRLGRARRFTSSGAAWAAAAAAAVVLLALLVGTLDLGSGDDSGGDGSSSATLADQQELHSSTQATGSGERNLAPSAGGSGGTGAGGTTTVAPRAGSLNTGQVPDLGPFADIGALRRAAGDPSPLIAPKATPADSAAVACPLEPGATRYVATLSERAVIVDVTPATIVVLDRATCAAIDRYVR
jgi:hypothetical protein